MAGSTHVAVAGTLTHDPRYDPAGEGRRSERALFRLHVERRWTNRSTGQTESQDSEFQVVCWRELARNVADSVKKGDRVIVMGRLEEHAWEKNGEKVHRVEIVADEVGPSLRYTSLEIV